MLSTKFCEIPLENPLFLAAGVLGSNASSLNWILNSGAGGVVTKSFSLNSNEGYKNPTTIAVEGGIINAIGLSNPGVINFKEELKKIDKGPVLASIYGSSPEEFVKVAKDVENLVDGLELNISCPHAMCGYGASIGEDPDLTYEFVKAVKDNVSCPVIAKLTPNVTDIVEIAKMVEKAGSDGLTLINSLGPGMKIDVNSGKPVLSNKFGGMSGPAIKPIAIKLVYEVFDSVNIPISGVGGISNYEDVLEFLFAGASVVQLGTVLMNDSPEIFSKIASDLKEFMGENNFDKIDDLVGLAHKGGF